MLPNSLQRQIIFILKFNLELPLFLWVFEFDHAFFCLVIQTDLIILLF